MERYYHECIDSNQAFSQSTGSIITLIIITICKIELIGINGAMYDAMGRIACNKM